MGPKYEFTGETLHWASGLLHRIKRLSDGKIGGWIESENNLSQEGNCWIDDNAHVSNSAKIYGNAQVYGYANVYGEAKIYGNAKVYGEAHIFGNACVFENAQVYDNVWVHNNARVYGNVKVYNKAKVYDVAQVYGDAQVYGTAYIGGDAQVFGNRKIDVGTFISGKYTSRKSRDDEESSLNEIVKGFIYKVDDSSKITTQIEYDSIDEFFNTPIENDIKLDTLIICAVDTKEPLIKLQKIKAEDKTKFKFIVDIINEDSDDFVFRSIIKSQEHLNELIQQTIDMLNRSPKFIKYVDDLENCL